ncbi:MAG TPA: hypothetical protein VN665_00230 [Candidatus Paceibacterota bacterium]|nr:hypothetical protein [Candidatus Paceibacterota bacterium]
MDSLARQLLPTLEPLQGVIKDWHCRVVPSAFNSADDALRALPLAREWRWPSAGEHFKRFKAETIILQLPSFWQLEPFVHFAAQAAGTPLCNVETQNYPLDKASIRLASANGVVAEVTEAAAIAEYLHKEQVMLPPYWLVLHAGDAPTWQLPELLQNKNLEVAEEVHLAPGVPLLVQCADIVAKQSHLFHTSDLFVWNANTAAATITSKELMLFTLADFPLPFTLKNAGPCACGQTLFAREA